MMDQNNQKQPSPEEQLQQMLFGLLQEVAPPGATHAQIAQVLQVAAQQETKLGVIYAALLDPAKVADRSRWGLVLHEKEGKEALFHAPKRLEECTDPAEVLIWLASFGMLIAPIMRAACMLHGWRFEWKDVKSKGAGPSIILTGNSKDD